MGVHTKCKLLSLFIFGVNLSLSIPSVNLSLFIPGVNFEFVHTWYLSIPGVNF